MIYWLFGVLLVLLVVAPFFNASMETRERRREYRAVSEARERWAPYADINAKRSYCQDLLVGEAQLRRLGATQAADKFATKRAELMAEIKTTLDELQRRSA